MNYRSKAVVDQAFLVLVASMIGFSYFNEPAQSQSQPSFTPTPKPSSFTPTPSPTPNPLLQRPPAPIPTRNPETPLYRKPLGGGASIDVNPSKKPPAAVEFQGPGKAKTRMGPVDMSPSTGGTGSPRQGGTGSPGQGGTGSPGKGGAGVGVNVSF